jgi:hypothetical protein
VALRITLGTQAPQCVMFRGASVVVDRARTFRGRRAPAAEIADCDDATLGAGTPCGVAPGGFACGGDCPPGETCEVDDPFLPSCHCVGPAHPCGDTAPACNGACPDGTACLATSGGTVTTCACLAPDACGAAAAHPTCGGSCPAGESCHAYSSRTGAFFTSAGCTCGPDVPCSCGGGLDCPDGTVCVVQAAPGLCVAACQ